MPKKGNGKNHQPHGERRTGLRIVHRLPAPPGQYLKPLSKRASVIPPRLSHDDTLSFNPSRKVRPHPAIVKLVEQARSRIYVLDTNVVTHDPTCLFRFEEHTVCLPLLVLEELDGLKQNWRVPDDAKRNAREFSRLLERIVSQGTQEALLNSGLSLEKASGGLASGMLLFYLGEATTKFPLAFTQGKVDNQILGVVQQLQKAKSDFRVILVSKDINMRIKAKALGLATEDYYSDKVIEDTDLLYSGYLELPKNFWSEHATGLESWTNKDGSFYRVTGPTVPKMIIGQFLTLEDPKKPLLARVQEITGRTAVFRMARDFTKHPIWGIAPRNREQNMALNLLMDPDCDLVTLVGQAGTGKTLLALAAGLVQTLERKIYSEIVVTRVTIPVGEDIGCLPGTEEEKMVPWMGALEDNLEVLTKTDDSAGEWGKAAANDLIRARIRIKSLNFMRGRSFLNKYLIIDECQNLTPKQVKTLVTRAGPGTKIVCLGNIAQIDTPYLTEGSSGLTYVVDHFKGWLHSGQVTLQRGERSRLADHAAEVL